MSRFPRLAVLIAAAALLVAAAPTSAPASGDGPTATASKSCSVGDSRSYGTTYVLSIRARNIGCRKARKKVRAFHACRDGARGRCPNLGPLELQREPQLRPRARSRATSSASAAGSA